MFRMALNLREQPPSETREGVRAVFSLLCRDGSIRKGEVIINVLRRDDAVVGALAVVREARPPEL